MVGQDGDTDRAYNIDVLYGTKASDILVNSAGDTVLDIHGGAGNDQIDITVAGIAVSTNAAYARGEAGNDTLAISWISTTNHATPGTAYYRAGSGNDLISVDQYSSTRDIDGNIGIDTVRYTGFTSAPAEDLLRMVDRVIVTSV
jgi:hypothetical protein